MSPDDIPAVAPFTMWYRGLPVRDGVVGIEVIGKALLARGFAGATTLEISGADALQTSAKRLRAWMGASQALT
jgi:hypothetical protein